MTLIIPYTSEQIYWHLNNNFLNLSKETKDKIVEQCNFVNMGDMNLYDEIAPNTGVSIANMLDDLKIEYNNPYYINLFFNYYKL